MLVPILGGHSEVSIHRGVIFVFPAIHQKPIELVEFIPGKFGDRFVIYGDLA